jgi:hypothetical protein
MENISHSHGKRSTDFYQHYPVQFIASDVA